MLTIGNKIRKMRELKDISQEYMAEKLGISQQMYSVLEKDANIPFSRLEQISEAMSVTVDNIISFDKAPFFNNINNNNGSVGMNIHSGIDPKIEKLYEDKIKLLEEKIKWMESK